MIKLTDFLNIDEPRFSQYKIHFAIGAKKKENHTTSFCAAILKNGNLFKQTRISIENTLFLSFILKKTCGCLQEYIKFAANLKKQIVTESNCGNTT